MSEDVPDDIREIEDIEPDGRVFVTSPREMDADEHVSEMLRATSIMAKMIIDKLEVDAKKITPGDYLVDGNGFFMIVSTNTDMVFRMTKMADDKWIYEVSQGMVETSSECSCGDSDHDA